MTYNFSPSRLNEQSNPVNPTLQSQAVLSPLQSPLLLQDKGPWHSNSGHFPCFGGTFPGQFSLASKKNKHEYTSKV